MLSINYVCISKRLELRKGCERCASANKWTNVPPRFAVEETFRRTRLGTKDFIERAASSYELFPALTRSTYHTCRPTRSFFTEREHERPLRAAELLISFRLLSVFAFHHFESSVGDNGQAKSSNTYLSLLSCRFHFFFLFKSLHRVHDFAPSIVRSILSVSNSRWTQAIAILRTKTLVGATLDGFKFLKRPHAVFLLGE